MRTVRALAIIPAAMLLLIACGDDSASTDTTTEDTTSDTASDTVQIDVVIGVDSGPDRVETVAVGTEVVLTVFSLDDDEIHVHVVDLELPVAAGESVTFTFVVDAVGPIEVESHVTEDVLVTIDVV